MEKGLEELKKYVIGPNKIEDIFIHQWFSDAMVGTKFQSSQTGNNGRWGVYRKDTVELLDGLKPKEIMIEAPRTYPHLNHLVGDESADQQCLASCFDSMKKSVLLAGTNYDAIVRTRIDVHYKDFIIINEAIHNATYVSNKYQPQAWIPKTGKTGIVYSLLTDFFMWGTPDVMNKMGQLFDHLEESNSNTASPHGEHYSGWWAMKNKFYIITRPIAIYGILRDSEQK